MSNTGNFKYELGDRVELVETDEQGTVVGRAEYRSGLKDYLIRYKQADGSLVKQWWAQDDIAGVGPEV